MSRAARQRARHERGNAEKVQDAFDRYLDHTVHRLEAVGVDSSVATEAIFEAVTMLGEDGSLPPFPEGDVHYSHMARWLVAAADFGFTDFMVEAAAE